jgi:carbamate kinase
MSKAVADRHVQKDGWKIVEDKVRGGWRRVVPSPLPREIIEVPMMRALLEADQTIVAAGGGGIPVARDSHGQFKGIEAVIDKDRTSALLAAELDADLLAILTNVDQVQKDYGKPTAQSLVRVNVAQLKQLASENQFSPGSMLPAGSSHNHKLTGYRNCLTRTTLPGSGIGTSTTDGGWRTTSRLTSRP